MAHPITNLRESSGDPTFYNSTFRSILEDHRVYLMQESNGSTLLEIPPGDAWRFRFNFYGLLRHMAIPAELRWITMRVNDMANPIEYVGTLTSIKIPHLGTLTSLADTFNTQYRTF
jgi:hypothetical protein